jgi:hypothetical protein
VLVGFGFEVKNLEANWKYVTNELSGRDFNFALTGQDSYEKPRLKCHTATEFLNASGIFAVADVEQIPVTAEIVKSITIPYSIIDQTPNDAELGALLRKIRMS